MADLVHYMASTTLASDRYDNHNTKFIPLCCISCEHQLQNYEKINKVWIDNSKQTSLDDCAFFFIDNSYCHNQAHKKQSIL